MLATRRGHSLWILCASTRDLWILGWFCWFRWLRGCVFWMSPSLQIGTFLVELWWSGKRPVPPWNHLGSSWIISVIFEILTFFISCYVIFTTFVTGLDCHHDHRMNESHFLELHAYIWKVKFRFCLTWSQCWERDIQSWLYTDLRQTSKITLRAPHMPCWRRVLRTMYHQWRHSQRPEDNRYEYCALAQDMYGFCVTFVGSYGSEGVFFGRCQVFKIIPF